MDYSVYPLTPHRHSNESWNPIRHFSRHLKRGYWIPALAGMTGLGKDCTPNFVIPVPRHRNPFREIGKFYRSWIDIRNFTEWIPACAGKTGLSF